MINRRPRTRAIASPALFLGRQRAFADTNEVIEQLAEQLREQLRQAQIEHEAKMAKTRMEFQKEFQDGLRKDREETLKAIQQMLAGGKD
jgi:recombinational DNA repair ATPase RecF